MPAATSLGIRYPLLTETANPPRDNGYLAADVNGLLLGRWTPDWIRIRQASDQAFGTGVYTNMGWATQSTSGAAIWSNSAGTVTVSVGGLYLVEVQGTLAGASTQLEMRVHAGSKIIARAACPPGRNGVSLSATVLLTAGAAVTASAINFGASSGTISADSDSLPNHMTITRLGGSA